jgi:hypothetical protein
MKRETTRIVTRKRVTALSAIAFMTGGLGLLAQVPNSTSFVEAEPPAREDRPSPQRGAVEHLPMAELPPNKGVQQQTMANGGLNLPELTPEHTKRRVRARSLMTAQERGQYRRALKGAQTQQARYQIRELLYTRLYQRAVERGVILIDLVPGVPGVHTGEAGEIHEIVELHEPPGPIEPHPYLHPVAHPHPSLVHHQPYMAHPALRAPLHP